MKHDDRDDREMPSPGWEELIEAAYLRIQAGLPPVPWLPNLPTLTGLRRQVRRARAGVIAPENPRIPARAWADTLEQGVVMSALEREEQRKQIEEDKRQEAEQQQAVLEYNRWWMEAYQALKRLPEASGATSWIFDGARRVVITFSRETAWRRS